MKTAMLFEVLCILAAAQPHASMGVVTAYAEASKVDSPTREARAKRWNGYSGELPLSASSTLHQFNYRHDGTDSLLFRRAAAIVKGTVTGEKSYLSQDKTTIYSELQVGVEEILYQHGAISAGQTIAVAMPGGAVRLDTKNVLIRGNGRVSVPTQLRRYVLVLGEDDGTGSYELLGGFLDGEHAYMTHSTVVKDGQRVLEEYGTGGTAMLEAIVSAGVYNRRRE